MRRPLHMLISLLSVQANAFPVFRPDVATSENEAYIQKAVVRDTDEARLQKIADERIDSATKPKPDIAGINVSMNGLDSTGGPDGLKLSDAYDVVAIVNKARDVQTLTLHRFYTDPATGKRTALKPEKFKISSGQERWTTCAPNKKGDAMESRWMGTPTGFFNPYYLHADHHSGQYDDATMYKAVFFNKVGIATHQGNVSSARASHGCIRMDALGSSKVFSAVLQSGKTMDDREKSRMLSGECPSQEDLKVEELAACKARALQRGEVYKMIAEKAIDEGSKLGLLYSGEPQIPDLTQEGKIVRDGAGQPKMRTNGYKALYVVQCIDKSGADCSVTANTPAFKNKPDCTNAQPAEQVVAKNAPGATAPRKAPANDDPIGEFFGNLFGGGQQQQPQRPARQRTTGL